jgi:hypothetical protein
MRADKVDWRPVNHETTIKKRSRTVACGGIKLIDRYVLRELLVPFSIGITIGVLLLIGTMLFQFAEMIINKGIPVLLVIKLLLLKAPAFAVIAMPMAMAFTASLAVNRLARDSELTPMRMAGSLSAALPLPSSLPACSAASSPTSWRRKWLPGPMRAPISSSGGCGCSR